MIEIKSNKIRDYQRPKMEQTVFKDVELQLGVDLDRWKSEFISPIIACYSWAGRYNYDSMVSKISLNKWYSSNHFHGDDIVHFVDGHYSTPALKQIKKLARQRLVKAFLIKDITLFASITADKSTAFLKEIHDGGAQLHFVDDTWVNDFLKYPVVSAAIQKQKSVPRVESTSITTSSSATGVSDMSPLRAD